MYDDREYDAAVAACDAALRIRPDHSGALLLRPQALIELRRYEEASRACDHCLGTGDGPPVDAYRTRGRARVGLGDHAGAVDDFSRALAGGPPDSDLLLRRGWSYGACQAWTLALRDFEEAVRLPPQDGDSYASRGLAHLRLGHDCEAVADAEEAQRLMTRAPEMLFNVACIFAQAAGRAETAAKPSNGPDPATHDRDRALEVIRQVLGLLPAGQRLAFWRDKVLPNADLDPIRHCPEFNRLDDAYRGPED